jgi:hypothetical protein
MNKKQLKTAVRTLVTARQLLRDHLWQQNGNNSQGQYYCAMGAIWAATGFTSIFRGGKKASQVASTNAALLLMGKPFDLETDLWQAVFDWNDKKGQTKAKVLSRFSRAITAGQYELEA